MKKTTLALVEVFAFIAGIVPMLVVMIPMLEEGWARNVGLIGGIVIVVLCIVKFVCDTAKAIRK